MNIKVNGEDTNLEKSDVSVTELLKIKDVKMPDMVSVEYNGEILDRDAFESTLIKEGDQLEFLYFMGGGI
jgi:sulfur carrier protein